MNYLRVKNWDEIYENNRTRDLKKMQWVPVPNKLDGDGYTTLVDHKNGAAHYGAWILILQVASKCDTRGTLVRGNGLPHDPVSLSRITRVPKKTFEETISRLSDPEIGWLEVVDAEGVTEKPQGIATIPQDGAGKPQGVARNGMEWNGMEEKGTEGKKTRGGRVPEKKKFGELGKVKLTDEEYAKLIEKHGKELAHEAIEILDTYIGTKGAKYQSHFACFKSNSWVWGRVAESKGNLLNPSPPQMTPEQKFEKELNDVIREYDCRPDNEQADYLRSVGDKYGQKVGAAARRWIEQRDA